MKAAARAPAKTNRSYAAWALTGIVGIVAFYFYVGGVGDGLSWQRGLAMRVVSPDFVAADRKAAQEVPDFQLPDRYGRLVRLSQFRDADLLLVNIWSSSCAVCREEVPELTEMDRRLSSIGKVALLTIAVEEKWADVAHYFPTGTDLRILFDAKDAVAGATFGTKKYPETFVLDNQRRILARFDGARPWHSDTMLEYLKTFL